MDLVGPLNANFDMYVSYGLKPNNFRFDSKSTKGASKESITIDNAKEGNYYVMIFSKQGSGNFTLTASSSPAPSAVVITSKENLKTKYGQEGFDKIEQKIKYYMKAVSCDGIKANLIYVDDANCLSPFNLRPVDPNNAGEIKDLIDSLDRSLNPRYFIIIGGHTVIPFHIVDNPAQDGDKIYTDNPYGSRDADILLPVRALGRLPDDKSNVPTFVIQLLETATSRIKKARNSSFGCSAQVCADAADNVFDSVRYGEQLNISPPVLSKNLDLSSIQQRKFMYFNLHGAEDYKYWYGDSGQGNLEPELIAFSPDNLEAANIENAIVYSEACYGANIVDKGVDDAICLKFLQKKAACFVGSTNKVTGADEPPILEGDLLGLKFLERIKEGRAFGDAFLRAKQDFARETKIMVGRLTNTDKKTLLEYVLYADPSLKIMEDNVHETEELEKLVMEHIRKKFPEFLDSEPIITEETESINRDVAKKLGLKISKVEPQTFKTFTFQRIVAAEGGAKIPLVCSVTVDENGNIIKATRN